MDKLQPARQKTLKYFTQHFQFQVQLNVTEIALLRKYLWIKMLSASSTSKKIYLNNSISKTILCPASMCNKEKALRYFLHGCVQLFDEFFSSVFPVFMIFLYKCAANSASHSRSFCSSFSVLQKIEFWNITKKSSESLWTGPKLSVYRQVEKAPGDGKDRATTKFSFKQTPDTN